MSVSANELRSALRQWASGITVVTAASGGAQHGMTVSSFSSVSLVPPLISVNIEQRTRTHDLMNEAGAFGVCVLADDQQNLAERFGGGISDLEDRFDGVPYRSGELGAVLLEGCIAALECRVHSTLPAGTHTVFIGEVAAAQLDPEKPPLLYWQRQYRKLRVGSIGGK